LLTTKVPDNATAIHSVATLLRSDTVVLCLQNGLHGEQTVRSLVGPEVTVIRGLTHCGAIFREPGVIDLKVTGATFLEQSGASEDIARLFSECGLDGRVSASIRVEVWRKLIANCVINPITSITGGEVGSISDALLYPLKQLVINECLAVAAAEGVAIADDMLTFINDTYGPSRNRASMLQDLARGHRTEIDFMNGAIADLGDRHHIPCPANRSLTTLIRYLEQRGAWDGQRSLGTAALNERGQQ
jgi:2-dehydropantoate 2-reductase